MPLKVNYHRRNLPVLCCFVVLFVIWFLHTRNTTNIEKHPLLYAEVAKFFFFKPDQFINQHNFTFTLTATVCTKTKYDIVMLVHSKPSNYRRRKLIRDTYGSVTKYQGKLITVVFLLGAVDDIAMQQKVMKESKRRRDITQVNFRDSYKNLTMKHIMAMHWFQNNCQADFVIKLDDDTFVNPYRLVEYTGTLTKRDSDVIFCKVMSNEMPIRNPQSKWATPFDQYPFAYFPSFCLGFAYITTPSVWRNLYGLSSSNRPMDMDDVFVTGILAAIAGVRRMDIHDKMYDCSANLDKFDKEAFRKAVFVIDRWNKCKDEPFEHWVDLRVTPAQT